MVNFNQNLTKNVQFQPNFQPKMFNFPRNLTLKEAKGGEGHCKSTNSVIRTNLFRFSPVVVVVAVAVWVVVVACRNHRMDHRMPLHLPLCSIHSFSFLLPLTNDVILVSLWCHFQDIKSLIQMASHVIFVSFSRRSVGN